MIPFYIYYSMFGFQRIGDLAWAAGDMRARGFLLGGTAGRTTLNGEGLQHEDGHSHIYAVDHPELRSYDPTFAYEVAVIMQDGLRRMFAEQEDVFYYITLMNENYEHPAHAARAPRTASSRACTCCRTAATGTKAPARATARRGTILREVIAAAELLADDSASRRRVERARASPNCGATAWRRSAGTCCIRPSRRAGATSSSCSKAATGR